MKTAPLLASVFLLAAALPAAGQEVMTAAAAERFVAGKLFSYSCFDGTEGQGRIFANGSAVGTIRPMGRGEPIRVRLPPGTLFVRDDRICATLRGLPFDPCFNVVRTSNTSFRGSVSGLGFMYCEFERGSRRVVRQTAPESGARGAFAGTIP